MHGKRTKKKSKRIPLNKKYKIEKKVREHHRKLKKEIKKNPGKYKKKKEVGVPNSFPFKAQVIQEAQQMRKEELEMKKEKNKQLKIRDKNDTSSLSIHTVSDLAKEATYKANDFESNHKPEDSKAEEFTDKSTKHFYNEFKKVVEAADVILEVLDARDPGGTRCHPLEKLVRESPNKRLVFILNKCDLVPRKSLEAWLAFLRKQHATILFKASTQQQSKKLSHAKAKWKHFDNKNSTASISQCVGADNLMQLLKNYCRNCGIKTAITVGVVGLPNVGKSSLINSLKRSKACNVGSTPGVTRNLQEVHIDSKVRLLDCPGLIVPDADASDAASALRNAVKIETLQDPVTPVQAILERTGHRYMMLLYQLPAFSDTMEFLNLLAKKSGKLGKDGIPNVDVAARRVLNDWNVGKIKYHTFPPAVELNDVPVSSTLLNQMTEEFDLQQLESNHLKFIKAMPDVPSTKTVHVEGFLPVQAVRESSSMDVEPVSLIETMDVDESKSTVLPENLEIPERAPAPKPPAPVKKPRWETVHKPINLSETSLKKTMKARAKKQRKELARNEKKADALADTLESFSGIADDNYDFTDYFNKA